MSLINEALKRTRDASYQAANVATAAAPPSYRVCAPGESRSWRSWPIVTGAVIVVGLMLVAVLAALFVQDRSARPVPPVAAVTAQTPVAPPVPALRQQPEPVLVAKPDPKIAEEQLVGRLLARLKAETPPAPVVPAPPPPKLQLQGVTSEGQVREAMINGATLRVGESIEGAQITAIEPRLVRLQFGSQELILRMR